VDNFNERFVVPVLSPHGRLRVESRNSELPEMPGATPAGRLGHRALLVLRRM